MRSSATRADALHCLVAALQVGRCDEVTTLRLHALGADAVTLAMLAAVRRIA